MRRKTLNHLFKLLPLAALLVLPSSLTHAAPTINYASPELSPQESSPDSEETLHREERSPQPETYSQTGQVDDELRQLLINTIAKSDSFEDRYDAEVWLVSKREPLGRFIDDHEERMDLLRKIHRAAKQADLRPEIVLALIEVESAFNPYAVSRVGAQGMMQIMPFWKNEIGRPDDNLIDIDTNLLYGCTILKHYLNKSDGRLVEALARYNGSYGKYWYPRRVMDAWQKHWR